MERKLKKSILIALVLGDGHIYIHTNKRYPNAKPSYGISFNHSAKQKEYLEYKVNLLHKALGGKKPLVTLFNNNGYPGVRASKAHKWFRYLRKVIYLNGAKTFRRALLNYLTPEGLAIWYMDDGNLSLKKRNGKIHSRELFLNTHLTREHNQIIIDYFREVWDVTFTQVKNRGWYRLRCGTHQAKKFIEIIKQHIIPSMFYKIDMKYS